MINLYSLFLFIALILNSLQIFAQNGMQLKEYMQLKGNSKPISIFTYGKDVKGSQFTELYIPDGEGKFPVIVLIHGGCWNKQYQGLEQMRALTDAFLKEKKAVWNIEYRCLDENGGGYPGTYQDIIKALNKLKEASASYPLDVNKIILVGHSAGGHLAQWATASKNIDTFTIFNDDIKVPILATIVLGSIPNLKHAIYACFSIKNTGGIEKLSGNFYKYTSPIEMGAPKVSTVLITGKKDDISLPKYAYEYKKSVGNKNTEVIIVPKATHYDEVSPNSSVWNILIREVNNILLNAKK